MNNKEQFNNLLRSIATPDEDYEGLIEYLEKSDWFEAPASTIYHGNYKGGLCKHSLNVYKNIFIINKAFDLQLDEREMTRVSLLHDLAKVDYYEHYIQNKKDYNDFGKQSDAAGRFDWIQVDQYRVKDPIHREHVFGEHGLCSYMIASKFLKLSDAEAAAIINHHMNLDNGKIRTDISEVMNRYPLATALCLADQSATYLDENPYRHE